MAKVLEKREDGFRLDYFLKSRNVTGGDLARECGMDIGRMSRLRNKGARPRVLDVFLLVQSARAILKDPTISPNDFIFVPGGVEDLEDRPEENSPDSLRSPWASQGRNPPGDHPGVHWAER